jgi:hypothetical protein
MLIKPISYWQQPVVTAAPAVIESIYLCGFNFYQWRGTRLGTAATGGIAKISLDGTLDTTWTANANPSTTQVRFFAPLNGNIFADYRVSTTRTFRKLNSTGTSVGSMSLGSAGSVWAMSSKEGNDFVIITGDTNISYNGTTVKGIGKINEDLALNSTFSINTTGSNGPNGFVNASHVSSNRIGVGGNFTTWNGLSAYDRFVVLNYDGTRDTGFSRTGNFVGGNVAPSIFIDNKWIVGGGFTTYNGVTNNRILAFNTDGTVDTTFTTNIGTGFNGTVNSLTRVSDTQILVGGAFTTLNGATRNRIALLNTDGTIPANIFGTGLDTTPSYITLDNTGKYYVTTDITTPATYNGNSSRNFFPINADGSINSSFVTGSAMQVNGTNSASPGGLFVR